MHVSLLSMPIAVIELPPDNLRLPVPAPFYCIIFGQVFTTFTLSRFESYLSRA